MTFVAIGASAFVLVHNHPSGRPKPSAEDIGMTRALSACADVIGIPLVDHVVVAARGGEPDVQIEELVRNENDERDLVETAASVIRGVEAGVDHPVRGWQCRSCPYAGACR